MPAVPLTSTAALTSGAGAVADRAAADELRRQVERHRAPRPEHAEAARAGEQRHIHEAEQRPAVDVVAHVGVLALRQHADAGDIALDPDVQRFEKGVVPRRVPKLPALPAGQIGIVFVGEDRGDRLAHVYRMRSASIFLTSAIAFAGLRPLGQVFAQFMIVWQRYRRNGSSSWSSRSPVISSRLSASQR